METISNNTNNNTTEKEQTKTPQDFITRETGEEMSDYKKVLDYALLPQHLRTNEYCAKRWNCKPSSSRLIKRLKDCERRCAEWDWYMQQLYTKATMTSYTKQGISLAEEHTKMWEKVREIGLSKLDKIINDPNELNMMSPKDALTFVDTAFKAERLLAGESTQNIAINAMILNTDKLSLKQKIQLRNLLKECTEENEEEITERDVINIKE